MDNEAALFETLLAEQEGKLNKTKVRTYFVASLMLANYFVTWNSTVVGKPHAPMQWPYKRG